MIMNWFKKNIKWFGPTVALFVGIAAFMGDLIPMPASAADLNKLVETVQADREYQEKKSRGHEIKHLQDQVANIRLQFMANGRQLSPEALFYIQEKETEIENIRKGED